MAATDKKFMKALEELKVLQAAEREEKKAERIAKKAQRKVEREAARTMKAVTKTVKVEKLVAVKPTTGGSSLSISDATKARIEKVNEETRRRRLSKSG